MKTVHAVWERKNLGMDAWEVTLEKKDMDDVQGVLDALRDPRYAGCYVCVKLPVGNLRMVHALEDDGFRFVETQLNLVEALERSDVMKYGETTEILPITNRLLPKSREEWGRIIDRITPGMFATDRIALDPAFGPDVACRRYRNWCWDLFDKPGSMMGVSSCDGEDISFTINFLDPVTNRFESVIGGSFVSNKHAGFAALIGSKVPQGKGWFKTSVSTNNLAMLKIHQNLGRVIRGEHYVFRKLYP